MTPRIELSHYIEHCRVLMRDVTHAISDYDAFIDGWTLKYAVDFSEIYSYVVPGESHEDAPIGDGWSNDPDRQFYVLSRFFGARDVLLPEPYAVELAGFVDLIGTKEFSGTARTYLQARREIGQILKRPDARRILERSTSADQPLSDDEADEFFRFFESYAPQLIAFARGVDLTPFHRLKDLFVQHTFTPLEKTYPRLDEYVRDAATRRRFDALAKLRTRSNPQANLIDARALGEVDAVNEILRKRGENTRVLLISRSENMMKVALSDARDSEVYVRHPRTMSMSYRSAEGGISLADHVELNIRKHSLEAFIFGAEEVEKKLGNEGVSAIGDILDAKDDLTGKTLRTLLEEIQSVWRNVEAYATGLTKAGETRSNKGSNKELTIQLLSFLRDPNSLRSRIIKQIHLIFREVRRSRDTVAFRLQRETAGRGSVVYAIPFESEALREVTEQRSAQWSSTLDDAVRIFDVAIGCEDDYECLLGIAVSLGAIGRWPLAKQYVDYAIAVRPDGECREALFLQAVTAKRMSIEDESMSQAMKRMHGAVERMEKLIQADAAIDPRFSNERAALQLWLIEFARNPEGAPIAKQQKTTFTPLVVATDLAKAVTLAAGKLKILILNNLCYAYLLAEDFKRMPQALDDLKEALTEAYSDRTNWPAFAVDTFVYTSFLLHRKKPSQDSKGQPVIDQILCKGWVGELRGILEQNGISSQEKRLIGGHANEIAEATG
jgi:hypothetical protein